MTIEFAYTYTAYKRIQSQEEKNNPEPDTHSVTQKLMKMNNRSLEDCKYDVLPGTQWEWWGRDA